MARAPRTEPYGVTLLGDRLFAARRRKGWSHDELGERSGLGRLGIRAVEAGKLKKLTKRVSDGLVKGFALDRDAVEQYLGGSLSLEDFLAGARGVRADTHRALLARIEERAGLEPGTLVKLAGEKGAPMADLSEALKNAVMGVVHVLGFPIESTMAVAVELFKEKGDNGDSAAIWFEAIRERLPKKPSSGTFFAAGKIKSPPKKRK